MSLKKVIIGGSIKYHRFKSELLQDVRIYLQHLIQAVVNNDKCLAQGVLNTLKKCKFLRSRHGKLCL